MEMTLVRLSINQRRLEGCPGRTCADTACFHQVDIKATFPRVKLIPVPAARREHRMNRGLPVTSSFC